MSAAFATTTLIHVAAFATAATATIFTHAATAATATSTRGGASSSDSCITASRRATTSRRLRRGFLFGYGGKRCGIQLWFDDTINRNFCSHDAQ